MSKSAQCPLILRYHRLMDAFAKSDDERDFYLSRIEGYLVYVDLDKSEEELQNLQKEIEKNHQQYSLLPKMTFYEVKKLMEGFVNEKVYDIDTKEKLLDIIGTKEAREHFLAFIYDNLTELEKWQLYYQERSRIRIIEWLRSQEIIFVFEEDLDSLSKTMVEKLKQTLFDTKVSKDVAQAREKIIVPKSNTYYSNEALNPKPKRGRPPKQVAKVEIEPQFSSDIYLTVPSAVKRFVYSPDITNSSQVTFSGKYEKEADLLRSLRGSPRTRVTNELEALSQRLESLRQLSSKLHGQEKEFGVKTGTFEPFSKPQLSGFKPISEPSKDEKIEKALEDFLPKKRGRPKKEDFVDTRKMGIKKVSPIKSKKKKS
jgi:hypothetical protein